MNPYRLEKFLDSAIMETEIAVRPEEKEAWLHSPCTVAFLRNLLVMLDNTWQALLVAKTDTDRASLIANTHVLLGILDINIPAVDKPTPDTVVGDIHKHMETFLNGHNSG